MLNICSNNPINLSKVISFMQKNNINPKIQKVSLQKADIIKTHGANKKLFKFIKHSRFADWKISAPLKVIPPNSKTSKLKSV